MASRGGRSLGTFRVGRLVRDGCWGPEGKGWDEGWGCHVFGKDGGGDGFTLCFVMLSRVYYRVIIIIMILNQKLVEIASICMFSRISVNQ